MSRLIRLALAATVVALAIAVASSGLASAAATPKIPPAPRAAKLQAKKHRKPSAKQRKTMERKADRLERSAQRGNGRMSRDFLITQPVGAIAVWAGCGSILGVWQKCTWEYQSYGYVVGTESYWYYWDTSIADWRWFATTTT